MAEEDHDQHDQERIRHVERQLARKEEELKTVQEELRVKDEIATVNQMTIRKQEHESSGTIVMEDSLDTIVCLENTLKLERSKVKTLLKDNKQLEFELSKRDKDVERLQRDYDTVLRETGYVKGTAQRQPFRDIKDQENRIGELQLVIQKLEEEQRTSKQIQASKTQFIAELSKKLDVKKNVEEDLYQAQSVIKVKDREKRDLVDELKTLKHQEEVDKHKKGALQEKNKEALVVKKLEGDKRFLQAEITKHVDMRRQQERTIKAQQFRIDQVEGRMDQLSAALKDLKLDKHMGGIMKTPAVPRDSSDKDLSDIDQIVPQREAIDIEAYELLQRDVEQLRNSLSLKDVIIQEKDQNVEALEKKVEILAHAKRTETRSILTERKEFGYQIEDLKRALDIQQDTYRQQADRLKQENARYKKKIRELAQP